MDHTTKMMWQNDWNRYYKKNTNEQHQTRLYKLATEFNTSPGITEPESLKTHVKTNVNTRGPETDHAYILESPSEVHLSIDEHLDEVDH